MSTILPVTPVKTAATTLETAVVADIHARLAALEVTAKTDETKVVAWLKTNWAHFVSWAGVGVTALKVFGKI